jgi:hypothetical protein
MSQFAPIAQARLEELQGAAPERATDGGHERTCEGKQGKEA